MGSGKTIISSDNFRQNSLFDFPNSPLNKAKKSEKKKEINAAACPLLANIDNLNKDYERKWAKIMNIDNNLNRSLVSFQANKSRAIYRWFKYKEAFSAGLVEYLLNKFLICDGILLDPFAGSGTALFAASLFGVQTEGIELLPIGKTIIDMRKIIEWDFKQDDLKKLRYWRDIRPWCDIKISNPINEFKITRGAYPIETANQIGQFLAALEQENKNIKELLFFCLLSILESISYTRKDGQYLRWDYRSGRQQGKIPFNKGKILSFDNAINKKLNEIINDLCDYKNPKNLFVTKRPKTKIILRTGSCLNILPELQADSYDCIITSPPYCNRYDYTRTYALELALLGIDETGLIELRQNMLSCTVENRSKNLLSINPKWILAIEAADNQALLQIILSYLDQQQKNHLLNNNGIPRMIRGYFYEMACVIQECARVLKSNSYLIMVNDNVRYAGAIIAVDIILSELAEKLGFKAEQVLVLPNDKGNSSQQMGEHGRESLRKCIYIWRKE